MFEHFAVIMSKNAAHSHSNMRTELLHFGIKCMEFRI